MTVKGLLKNLIWPAVAGNVAWAFFWVLVVEATDFSNSFGRLFALLLLGAYLIITYWRSEDDRGQAFDIAHSVTIIGYAISLQANVRWMDWMLIVLYSVAAVGHWSGRWIPGGVNENRRLKKVLVGCIHVVGILVWAIVPESMSHVLHVNLPISMAIVLLLWWWLRDRIYS